MMLSVNRIAVAIALVISASAVNATFVTQSTAAVVYPFCDIPPPTAVGHTWYVDPLRGTAKGDGSRLRPWHTLAEVIAANMISTAPSNMVRKQPYNANPPIKPGDTIFLMTGNHGAITLQGFYSSLIGYNNNQFITIAAAPGQLPVISQLQIMGGSHWVIRGITFTSNAPPGASDYTLLTLKGPHDNIIVDGNKFLSQADVRGWSIAQTTGSTTVRTTCLSTITLSQTASRMET